MKKVKIMLGNCLERMKEIESGTIDMILCDLPYGTTRCSWDSVIPFEPLWEQYERVIKEKGAIVLFAAQPFTSVLTLSNLKLFRYEWIWEKTAATGHLNAKKMPMKAHENILVFYKSLPSYYPIKTKGHVRKSATADRGKLGSDIYGNEIGITVYNSAERYPRSVLKFSSDKQTSSFHPTQKPVSLCEYLIRTYTSEGETVLDNTMGSGSTGVACVNTNRSFIGIEKEEKYFFIAQERITSTVNQQGYQYEIFIR